MHPTAQQLIEQLQLKPHPEGGYYAEIYRSSLQVTANQGARNAMTAIYYLLNSEDYSAWHRIKSDEIWHYYAGYSLTISAINEVGELVNHRLGNPLEHPSTAFQVIIPANQWFAARPDMPDSYTLVGCTVAPGFEFADFELADTAKLLVDYPAHITIINQFASRGI